MITEAQRRALFALREALRLCDEAQVTVSASADLVVQVCLWDEKFDLIADESSDSEDLMAKDVDRLLGQHPEPIEHNFQVGQKLLCRRIPDRHEGYFTPGKTYQVDALDSVDSMYPIRMTCDSKITLWCESSAFEAHHNV